MEKKNIKKGGLNSDHIRDLVSIRGKQKVLVKSKITWKQKCL